MDHVSKETRSKIMAAVKSRGNKSTEAALSKLFREAGLRGYRKHWPVDGTPDFAWPGLKVAVFVDGCFWHGCRCKCLPRTHRKFWMEKIGNNQRRDRRVAQRLRRAGWRVMRVKECVVKRASTLKRIALAVESRRGMLVRSAGHA
jgi:DNA mismatch endonuclease (patch repair protein)